MPEPCPICGKPVNEPAGGPLCRHWVGLVQGLNMLAHPVMVTKWDSVRFVEATRMPAGDRKVAGFLKARDRYLRTRAAYMVARADLLGRYQSLKGGELGRVTQVLGGAPVLPGGDVVPDRPGR